MSFDQFMGRNISPMRFECNRQSDIFLYQNCDMETFANRVRIRRKEMGLSQKELARLSGLSQTTISDIERGRNDASREIVELAAALQCRSHWLKTGDGPRLDSSPSIQMNVTPTLLGGGKIVPRIALVQAGNWRAIVDDFTPGCGDDWVMCSNDSGPHTFGLVVTGNSMEPDFKEGDTIIVDPDIRPTPGCYVVARNHRFEATFKQYKARGVDESGQERFELKPLNDDYATISSDEGPIEIIGKVIEHRRKLR